MVNCPVVRTLATPEPEIEPISADEMTATLAAPLGMADEAEGNGIEQVDHAGMFEKGAEQHEQEDVAGRDHGWNAEDAFGTETQLVHHLRKLIAAMRQVAGQVLPEQAVEQEECADGRQGQAKDAPRCFKYQQDHRCADPQINRGRLASALDQLDFEDPLIGR